jgi:hypothetical protein
MFLSRRILSVKKPQVFASAFSSAPNDWTYIKTESKGRVGVITLNRPKQLNALCTGLLLEVIRAGKAFDADDKVKIYSDNVGKTMIAFES